MSFQQSINSALQPIEASQSFLVKVTNPIFKHSYSHDSKQYAHKWTIIIFLIRPTWITNFTLNVKF